MNQFIFANESSIVFNQILQGLKRLGAQLDLCLPVQQTTARQIEREPVKGIYLMRPLLHWECPGLPSFQRISLEFTL